VVSWTRLARRALQIPYERYPGVLATVANVPRNDELGIGFNAGPGPNVASAFRGGFGEFDVLLLGVAERPNFVRLNRLGGNAAHRFVMEGRASQSGIDQQLRNGIDRYPGDPGDRTHAGTLAKHAQDLDAGF
jgi:hypothetical protein